MGGQLVRAFCQALAERAVSAVCLTTDHSNNEKVNLFYENLGFRLGRTYVTADGRPMNEYVMTIDGG
jgi:ribosomal protein S18 acetylase RimI-like enzyme